MKQSFTVIDLFCGAGGLSEGFSQAGYEPLLGIDCDPWAAKTFEKYHSKVICEKIEKISVNRITREIHGREVTVLAGGPPCQAFSTIACAKNRSIGHSSTMRHPLNVFYKEFLRLVNGIEPKFFVMENVPRMFSVEGGVVKREIERVLEGKYHVTFYKEDVACFGVPQFRKRVLAIGNMLGLKNPTLRHTHFPPHTAKRNGKRPFVTVRDAISDLPKLQIAQGKKFVPYVSKKNLTNYQRKMREKSEGFDEHISRSHSWRDLKIFNLLKPRTADKRSTKRMQPIQRRYLPRQIQEVAVECAVIHHNCTPFKRWSNAHSSRQETKQEHHTEGSSKTPIVSR